MDCQYKCLRCEDQELEPIGSEGEIAFFRCNGCHREYALRKPDDSNSPNRETPDSDTGPSPNEPVTASSKEAHGITDRWLSPLSLVLYGVSFAEDPPSKADAVARLLWVQKDQQQLQLIVSDIRDELAEPKQRVKDILNLPQSEDSLREFLSRVADHLDATGRPNIETVQFDTSEWIGLEFASGPAVELRDWDNEHGESLRLQFFANPDPPPFDVYNIPAARNFARTLAEHQGGGVVEADMVVLSQIQLFKTLFKYPLRPSGYGYTGSYAFYVSGAAYSVKFQCLESGLTGIRETAVASKLGVSIPGGIWRLVSMFTGRFDEWFQDPYAPAHRAPVLRCRADDIQWDSQFPNHPLSRLRHYLARFEQTFEIRFP